MIRLITSLAVALNPASVVDYNDSVVVEYASFVEEDYRPVGYEIPEPNVDCDNQHHDDFIAVARLASVSGFPDDEVHTAVAVAYAESNGHFDAINRNRNGSRDSGLWQINSVHGFTDLKNPDVNGRAAFEVWSVSGWRAWYAHTPRGGEYGSGKRFLYWLEESKCSIDEYLKR